MKKLIAVSLISLLTLGSAQTAMAAVIYHNLSTQGDLEISSQSNDTYEVTSSGETSNVIIVNDRISAYIVLKGVTIKTTNKNGISIGQNADVVLELDGTNSIEVDDGAFAGINVANGTLTIKDENNGGSLEVATNYNSDSAGIGSDKNQDFNGTIVIEGGTVTAKSTGHSAGIGSGIDGDFNGKITISGGNVIATSTYFGAGIGSGMYGDFTGSVDITGGTIRAESFISGSDSGAGIGSGARGNMSGNINISGNSDVTAAAGNGGAGIGSGSSAGNDNISMSGNINISGGNVHALSDTYGAGIGSGIDGDFTGTISISGDSVVTAESKGGAAIGSGAGNIADMTGTISISGGLVTAESSVIDNYVNGSGIGSGYLADMSGTISISGGEVRSAAFGNGSGIGSGAEGSITSDGKVIIGGDAKVTTLSADGASIGSGKNGDMDGKIFIRDNADVDIYLGYTRDKTGIGTRNSDNNFGGSIEILGNSKVDMEYMASDNTPIIGKEGGSTTGTITLSRGAAINGVSGESIDELKEMGILDEVTNVNSVDPSYAPEESNPVIPDPVDPGPDDPDDPGYPELDVPKGESYSLSRLSIKQRIDKAQAGDTVSVSESQLNKGKLPSYILEALALKDDVTLAIFCEEFCILIPSDEAVADAGSKQFYTIDELVKMYE